MSIGPKKPRLSGAQRRKLAKERASAAGPQPVIAGEVLRRIRVGQLDTIDQWRTEISKVYREMRLGKIRSDEGTRLTYVANIAAQLAKIAQELKELEALRQQLAALQSAPSNALIQHDGQNGDYIPAAVNPEDQS
jgi:hypothetical protein